MQSEMLTNITRMNMMASPSKFALLTHITFSVGWFGAVVPYPALVIAGLTSRDLLRLKIKAVLENKVLHQVRANRI
jgi:hypothetical protein